jgi:hypothetical protein
MTIGDRGIYFVDDPGEIANDLVKAGARVNIRQRSLEDYVLYRVGAVSEP